LLSQTFEVFTTCCNMLSDGDATGDLYMDDGMVWHCQLSKQSWMLLYIVYCIVIVSLVKKTCIYAASQKKK